MTVLFSFIIWIFFAIITLAIAINKGLNGCLWFFIGFILGPFGLILALIVKEDKEVLEKRAIEEGSLKKCHFCGELIKPEAKLCRYCGKNLNS